MKDRIQQNYGIDVNTSDYNAQITDIWDTMQQWVGIACLGFLKGFFRHMQWDGTPISDTYYARI